MACMCAAVIILPPGSHFRDAVCVPVCVSGHVGQVAGQVYELREAIYQVDAHKGVLSMNKKRGNQRSE